MFTRISLSLLSSIIFFICFSACKSDEPEPEVTTDEGIYINELYASEGDDWIELFNTGDQAKDLSGYKIYDDPANRYVLPPNTFIDPKSYLIIVCDDSGTGLFANFKLSSLGETVYLENAAGKLIDKVAFPALEDGQSYGRYPDGSGTLKISGTSTRGETNGETIGTIINSISRAPLVPALNESVKVNVEILSTTNVSSVKLFYCVNGGGYSQVAMTAASTVYSGTIPALNATGIIDYYVEVANSSGVISRIPHDAPEDTYTYFLNDDPLPALRINEFMANNVSCCPDTDGGTQEFDDWIEIYNGGATAVNIADFYLSDDLSNPFNSRIKNTNAAKTTIPPGGFLLIWADNNSDQGELHLDFGLSTDGEDVALFYKDGRKIDSYSFGAQTANRSFGLKTNGGSVWQAFTAPTPGRSNE